MRSGPSARRRDTGGAGTALALVALLLAAAACHNSGMQTTGPSTPPDSSATFTRVQREVFTPSCALAGCHAASSAKVGLVLDAGRSYASLVGVVSAETSLLRVMAGLPNDSYLVVKLRADASIVGSRMPPEGPALPSGQLQLVVDWIRRGAPND